MTKQRKGRKPTSARQRTKRAMKAPIDENVRSISDIIDAARALRGSADPPGAARRASRTPPATDPTARLGELISGAKTDDEQLRALLRGAHAEVALPTDAFVIGEPIQVTAIEYDGNPRRAITATCRRGEERHVTGLADVVFSPGSHGAAFLALYRSWLGLPDQPAAQSAARGRRHKADSHQLKLDQPLHLIVLACRSTALRCRVPGTERELTLRTAVRDEVPGEVITVLPKKTWTHGGHPYVSGNVQSSRLDVLALGLTPLQLRSWGDWDPEQEYWGEPGDPIPGWARPIIARGKRPAFEFEQVVPGADPADFDSDPILQASELSARGARGDAYDLLMGLLAQDLRCLDAHAHLGNIAFDYRPEHALRHYTVGLAIGALALDSDFDGVLPWGLIHNRPFLRCLNGAGLSYWKLAKAREAAAVFRRMLWLNPSDNQGARFNLADVQAGRTQEEAR